jgi:GcrA cell cycle regulator
LRRLPAKAGRRAGEGSFMQSFSWTPEHSEALREQIVRGRSYGEAVDAINTKFGTDYTRAAALGRGKRMGLVTPARPDNPSMLVPRGPQRPRRLKPKTLKRSAQVSAAMLKCGTGEAGSSAPAAEHPEPPNIRSRRNCAASASGRGWSRWSSLKPTIAAIPMAATGRGAHQLLRPPLFSRVQLLRPAFPSDARAGHRNRASGRSVRAAAGPGRLTRAQTSFFSLEDT